MRNLTPTLLKCSTRVAVHPPPPQRQVSLVLTNLSSRRMNTRTLLYQRTTKPARCCHLGSRTIILPAPAVPPYADRQPIAVNRELEHYNSANLYLPRNWANSPLDNVQHAPFNDPGTAYDSPSSINIDELSRQPQQIDVGCDVGPGDFAMAFSSMGPSAEQMDYNMGNPSYNEISPTGQYEQAFWQEPHQSMGNFPMCMDVQEATEQSIGSGHSKAHGSSKSSRATSRTRSKRQRSDSPSAGSSSAQSSSPSGPSTGTRHTQRRQVVGSDATRRAGEKRRRAPATFVCDICGSVFTRNHNRQNHIRTHNGEAGAQCTICNKFLAKTSLSRHMKKCRGTS
ncbi:hypothetical protein BDN70DRAFT_551018 [Pholiota conissans]|uniref:C2H2-type domain-containing protein n=1 Tax=Pholiota conissans TaxID=109636 RepID=A0A9P5YN48_9AGAR|nr:hypothetical protein BDN70DRAFT_551018 [Pholiota conissans]